MVPLLWLGKTNLLSKKWSIDYWQFIIGQCRHSCKSSGGVAFCGNYRDIDFRHWKTHILRGTIFWLDSVSFLSRVNSFSESSQTYISSRVKDVVESTRRRDWVDSKFSSFQKEIFSTPKSPYLRCKFLRFTTRKRRSFTPYFDGYPLAEKPEI